MALKGSGSGGGASAGAIRAGHAFVELGTRDTLLIKGLQQARAKLLSMGATLSKLGAGLFAGGGAGLGAFAVTVKETISHFDSIAKAADRLGTTPEILSTLAYAAKQSGSDISEVEAATAKFQRTLAEAAEGGKEASESFAELGLSVEELMGLDLLSQLSLVADALSKVENPARRMQLGMELLGKSARQMFPLLKDGAAGLAKLRAEAEKRGAIISEERARQAERVGDAFDRLSTSIKFAILEIGAAILPAVDSIEDFEEQVATIIKGVREWIKGNRELVLTIVGIAAAVTAAGAVILGLGLTLGAVGLAIGGIATAVGVLLTPVGLITLAIAAFAAAIVAAGVAWAHLLSRTKMGQEIIRQFGEYWQTAAATFTTAWGGITAAIQAGDLTQALRIAMAGLAVEWNKGILALNLAWHDFIKDFKVSWINAILVVVDAMKIASVGMQAELSVVSRQLEALRDTVIGKDVEEAKKNLTNAMNVLGYLTGQAAAAGRAGGRMEAAGLEPKVTTQIARAAGQFGGQNLGAAFAYGQDVNKQQLAAQLKIAAGIDENNKQMDELIKVVKKAIPKFH